MMMSGDYEAHYLVKHGWNRTMFRHVLELEVGVVTTMGANTEQTSV